MKFAIMNLGFEHPMDVDSQKAHKSSGVTIERDVKIRREKAPVPGYTVEARQPSRTWNSHLLALRHAGVCQLGVQVEC